MKEVIRIIYTKHTEEKLNRSDIKQAIRLLHFI